MSVDTLKMIREVDRLTSSDALDDWSWKAATDRPFTQEESAQMAVLLGRIYLVAHAIHCEACRGKWLKASRSNTESKEPRSSERSLP